MPVALPLDQMSLEEKLQAMEAIWESISRHPDSLESPGWHGEVLRERQRQVAAGEAYFMAWEEAQNEIDQLMTRGDDLNAAG
jgi:hypothetical protein